MERINTLRTKLDMLLRNYKAMQAELAVVKSSLHAKDEEIAWLRSQLARQEGEVLALSIGKAIPDAESRANARKQLDSVINEIDKILTSLHD